MTRFWVGALLVAYAGAASAEVQKTVQPLTSPLGFDHLSLADGLPNSDVHVIAQDRRGFLWFGTQDGLARYDGTQMRVYRPTEQPTSLSGGYITALVIDETGKIWVGTAENGVDLYDPDTDQFTRYPHGKGSFGADGVTAIARDTKNRIWFATGSGLERFDPATKAFVEYATGPLETAITAIAVDPSGALWLGTTAEGIVRWDPDSRATSAYRPTPNDPGGLGTAQINAIHVATNGHVWIATDGDGLVELDPGSRSLTHYHHIASDPLTLSDDHVTAIFEDRRHEMWIGTTNGLDHLRSDGKFIQYNHDPYDPSSLAFPGIESIFEDAGGVMWIGGFVNGVCKFDDLQMAFGHYRTRSSANSYYEDSDGTLWVGTYNGGLYKYEFAARRMTLYRRLGADSDPAQISLESSWITALHRDKRGTLWISLKGQGLIAFDTTAETYRQYLPEQGNANSLPVDTLLDIAEDPNGDLWLASAGGGLVHLDVAHATFSAITSERNSGLTSNFLYTLYRDPREPRVLWLGTSKGGLIKFDTVARTGTAFQHRADNAQTLASDDVTSVYRDSSGIVWAGTYGGGLARLDPTSGVVKRYMTSNSTLGNDVLYAILPDDEGKLWLTTNGAGLFQFDPKTESFLQYTAADGVQDNEFGQGSFMRDSSGRLFVGGPGGFNAFLPRDLRRDKFVPPVAITGFKVLDQDVLLKSPIWTLPSLTVSYSDSIELRLAALSFAAPARNRYAYELRGFDDRFHESDRPYATYTKLPGGTYTLVVKAANEHGVWNDTGIELVIHVKPPLYLTWPAFVTYFVILAAIATLIVRNQRQKVRRIEREARLAVVERDLALSGAVQSGFLPQYNQADSAHTHLFGFYRAADACSGDWWWHDLVGNRHLVLVGDVTGHGPGPAMVTAAVATAFRLLSLNGGLGDIQQVLQILNGVVLDVAKGKYHMTMAALELDELSGSWTLYSAATPPLLHLDRAGKHRVLFCPGTPLGSEQFETGQISGRLDTGERLLVYTDGMPEVTLTNGNVLGIRRFAQMYEQTRAQNVADAAQAIVQQVDELRSNSPQADDWTFALVEWRSS